LTIEYVTDGTADVIIKLLVILRIFIVRSLIKF